MRSLVLAALAALSLPAFAQELVVQHQGMLLDAADAPVSGIHRMTFSLWASETAEQPVWEATYDVTVGNGRYAVALGTTRGGLPALTAAHLSGPRWLGVAIEDVELLPRLRVGDAPRAVLASDAEKLGGLAAADYALKTEVAEQIAAATPEGVALLEGATFTGPVTLAGAPATTNAAATKGYVDGKVGEVLAGATFATPTSDAHAATKGYVDAQVAAAAPVGFAKLDGSLPFTGAVTLPGAPTQPKHAVTKEYVDGFRPPADGNLLVSFDFEETTGSTFSDGSSYERTASAPAGGIAPGSEGHSGKAVHFSGGVVSVSPPATVADSSQIWIETWVRPVDPMTSTRTIVSKSGSYALEQEGRNLRFEVTGAVSQTPCVATTTGNLLSSGVWSHVSGWYDGVSLRVAINGVTRGSADCPNGPIRPTPNSAFVIGGVLNGDSVQEPYAGAIDELRVRATAPVSHAPRTYSNILNVTVHRVSTRQSLSNKASHTFASFTVDKKSPTSILLIDGAIAGWGNHGGSNTQVWQYGSGPEVYAQGHMYDDTPHSKLFPTKTIIEGHTQTGPQTMQFRYATANGSADAPFLTYNPNASDDARLRQTSSVYTVWEIEQAP